MGEIVSGWELENGEVTYTLVIPFGVTAAVSLPLAAAAGAVCNHEPLANAAYDGECVRLTLTAGTYCVHGAARPADVFSSDTPIGEMLGHKAARPLLMQAFPVLDRCPDYLKVQSLRQVTETLRPSDPGFQAILAMADSRLASIHPY